VRVFAQTPDGGVHPQADVEAIGVLHLTHFKGEPAAGDLQYVRRGGSADTSRATSWSVSKF
jgi:hypothetical protein